MTTKRSSESFGAPKSLEDYAQRYPRVLARIARAASLESINQAAVILRDAVERRKNYSEWVLTQFGGDALQAVRSPGPRKGNDKSTAIE
jgi:hypothetical protein